MKASRIVCLIFSGVFGLSAEAGEEIQNRWALPLSLTLGAGSLENSEAGLKSRVMTAASFEALPAYRFGEWMIGAHFDYRAQGQVTSIGEVDGTNLKGQGWLAGLAVRRAMDTRFFVQLAVDVAGEYNFTKAKSSGEESGLRSPLGVRLKLGRSFWEAVPGLSFDADFQYLSFQKEKLDGLSTNAKAKQFMLGLGLTYQWQGREPALSSPVEAASAAPVVTDPKISGAEKVGEALRVSLSGLGFESGSAQLKPESEARLATTAREIAEQDVAVRIEGHSDSSGPEPQNIRLSQMRADAVKAVLLRGGVPESRVRSVGLGSSKPLVSNDLPEGREKNRRVEIYIEAKK